MEFTYRSVSPPASLTDYVDSFWMLVNTTEEQKEVIVLPDGRVDVFFTRSSSESYHAELAGLGSGPGQGIIAPGSLVFAVSFKLPAVEYILETSVASLNDTVQHLPSGFWGVTEEDLRDFEGFCKKASAVIHELLSRRSIDARKQKLFTLIYASQGESPVQQLSDAVGWSSRQINRYFNQWFGLSLKTYCNILRYRASFPDIKEGKLFSGQNFSDQAHFIKDVKKFSGVTPGELNKNKNDRFIQFSTLPKK